ncbi:testis-expressed protein 13A-like [Budorcas taxicolor]|uniref:testis-expressed protein 13A-like n=1 Tax=Budorcas taxicolor TaxID=37181 RepID=UPI0022838E9D|nr:testis-expressed protein 13A-like [Budorcas taxicolor]
MALKSEDVSSGFRHGKVMAFINERMSRHAKGPEFYLENLSLSWEKVEDKLRAILEDRLVPSQAKEACAWSSLALGVRFAYKQSQLHRHRVQWLHDFAGLHRSAAQALASDLTLLAAQHEVERKEAAFQLKLTQASLAEVQKERDLLKWKIFKAELQSSQAAPVTEGPSLAPAGVAGTEGTSEEEEETGATATTAAASEATGGGRQYDADGAEAAKGAEDLSADLMQLLGVVDQKNYTSGGQREGDFGSVETAMYSFSGMLKPEATVSPEPLPVQLPASFTYSYSCPLSPFPDAPTPSPHTSPPQALFTAGALSQTSPHWGSSDFSLWSDGGIQGIDPQGGDRNDSDPLQQLRRPVFHRPGSWDCPWCKSVNFSLRGNCFHCGKGIWLQSS